MSAQPNQWDNIINLSTINYFVAFVSASKVKKIKKKLKEYDYITPDWIDNYKQYGPYVCINLENTAWEEILYVFRKKANLSTTTGTASCILYDNTHNALLSEFDCS